jgi:hypothetical protein
MIRARNGKTVNLQTMTGAESVPAELIAKTETLPMSLMPEGLVLAMQPDQFRDLIGYLMHPVQVELPAN